MPNPRKHEVHDMWGDPSESALTTAVQYAAFIVIAIAIIIGLTSVG